MDQGFSPLSVVPAQDPHKYPKKRAGEIVYQADGKTPEPLFNGKCPSYFDSNGNPRLISGWQKYGEQLPTDSTLRKWFDHPEIMIGHFAVSVDGRQRVLDLDRKDFSGDSHFERETDSLVSMATHLERTPGGGYHALIEFTDSDPVKALGKAQANIGLGDVDHAGELPQFVVSYPTPGYELVKAGPPLKVRSLEDIGVRFTSHPRPQPVPAPATPGRPGNVVNMPGLVNLELLINKRLLPVLNGEATYFKADGAPDRSESLVAFANDCYGWESLAQEMDIRVTSAQALIDHAARALGIYDKKDVCLSGINPADCKPGLQGRKGRPAAESRLRRLATKNRLAAEDGKLKKLNKVDLVDFVSEKFDCQLNAWSGDILVDGEEIDLELFHIKLALEHGIEVSKDGALDTVNYVAQSNVKDDVLEYLDSLSGKPALSPQQFDRIAEFCGISADPFDNLALKKFLIAAVARIYRPGCKADECPVFHGPQGVGKSTFLEILAGKNFFTDEVDLNSSDKKDTYAKLGSNWVVELGEFDQYTNRKESGELKQLVTANTDEFRVPYARKPKKVPRRCVFAGTANPAQFLVDTTGNRRYPIIRFKHRIDLGKITEYRDQIWGAAVQAYERGEPWHYNEAETELINQRAAEYSFEDPWEVEIANYIEALDITHVNAIFQHALTMLPGKATNRDTGRVIRTLQKLGWEKGERKRIEGKLIYPWYPPASPCQKALEKCESGADYRDVAIKWPQFDIEKSLCRLSEEKQAAIHQFAAEPNPLPDDVVQGHAELLEDVAGMGDRTVLVDAISRTSNDGQTPLKSWHPIHKKQLWSQLSDNTKSKITAILEAQNEDRSSAS